jgi:hypothetical protein
VEISEESHLVIWFGYNKQRLSHLLSSCTGSSMPMSHSWLTAVITVCLCTHGTRPSSGRTPYFNSMCTCSPSHFPSFPWNIIHHSVKCMVTKFKQGALKVWAVLLDYLREISGVIFSVQNTNNLFQSPIWLLRVQSQPDRCFFINRRLSINAVCSLRGIHPRILASIR